MNPTQMTALRQATGVREGHEWDPLEGVGGNARPAVEALLEKSEIAREKRARGLVKAERMARRNAQGLSAESLRIYLDVRNGCETNPPNIETAEGRRAITEAQRPTRNERLK